jgi:hypothetical protein
MLHSFSCKAINNLFEYLNTFNIKIQLPANFMMTIKIMKIYFNVIFGGIAVLFTAITVSFTLQEHVLYILLFL